MDAFLSLLLTPQFGATCVAVAAIMATLKRFTKTLAPRVYARPWFRAFMTTQNLCWGIALAWPPFLPGETYSERAILGVCAGFVSHFVYHLVIKRFGGGAKSEAVSDQEFETTPPGASSR